MTYIIMMRRIAIRFLQVMRMRCDLIQIVLDHSNQKGRIQRLNEITSLFTTLAVLITVQERLITYIFFDPVAKWIK